MQANKWNLIQITGHEIFVKVMEILRQDITNLFGLESAEGLTYQLELKETVQKAIDLSIVVLHHPIVNDYNYL
jgi:hypothetical protein